MEQLAPRTIITTEEAPSAIGPYSQAVVFGGLVYCSGALPIDVHTGEMVNDSPAAETRQALENLHSVCVASGAELRRAVRVVIYTTRLDAFAEINEVYAEFFDSEPPARVTIGVAALPKAASVEIEAMVPTS